MNMPKNWSLVSFPVSRRDCAPLSPDGAEAISAPLRGTVVSVDIESGQSVQRGQRLATLESMKMHHDVEASASGTVVHLLEVGRTVDEGEAVVFIQIDADADETRTGLTN